MDDSSSQQDQMGSGSPAFLHGVIDYLPGSLLLLAGLVKVNHLRLFANAVAQLLRIDGGGSAVVLLSTAVFSAEMTAGCLLLAFPGDRIARRLGAMLFLVFALVQLQRLLTDVSNPCGCFGLMQGAAFLRPFADPGVALLSNLFLAAVLLCDDAWRVLKKFYRFIRTDHNNQKSPIHP